MKKIMLLITCLITTGAIHAAPATDPKPTDSTAPKSLPVAITAEGKPVYLTVIEQTPQAQSGPAVKPPATSPYNIGGVEDTRAETEKVMEIIQEMIPDAKKPKAR